MKPPRIKPLFIAALALLLGGLAVLVMASPGKEKQRLGLMTSLPIYWSEVGDFNELLVGDQADTGEVPTEQHWVRTALEDDYTLVLLDSLHKGNDGAASSELAGLDLLLLAQPRTMVPLDNVALDIWVRDGGTLLMFADPMLTEGSRFGFGDKRRPQDVGLVSPVFARWGISQSFAEGQAEEGEIVIAVATQIAVNQRGTFVLLPAAAIEGDSCALSGKALIAECQIGDGRAFLIGDAALLDSRNAAEGEGSLKVILHKAFSN